MPKNEREWWASREIEKLERELADANAECAKFETELTRLRAEVYQARKAWLGDDYGHLPLIDALERFRSNSDAESDRADIIYQRACEVEHELRAELADWSVLNLWGGTPKIIHEFIKGQQNRIHHCQDLEAELATEKARLDYLALNMGTPRVADALNCDYSRCFPIRDAIDLAIKNETPTP